MKKNRLEVRAERDIMRQGVSLYFFHYTPADTIVLAEPMIMSEVDEGVACRPTMTMQHEDAQLLMDELWRCGLRPTEGTGSAGAMAAVEKHLADMRKIAFKKLGVE